MTEDERREYATTVLLDHARDVGQLSIYEMAEDHIESGEISDEDARLVLDLIRKANVTVAFPVTPGGTQ